MRAFIVVLTQMVLIALCCVLVSACSASSPSPSSGYTPPRPPENGPLAYCKRENRIKSQACSNKCENRLLSSSGPPGAFSAAYTRATRCFEKCGEAREQQDFDCEAQYQQ